MYPWKNILAGCADSSVRYQHICNGIIDEIKSGRLKPNHKLPGTRFLANLLQVNRKTVIRAFEELQAEGWVNTHPSSGTYVANNLPIIHPSDIAVLETDTPFFPNTFDSLNYIPEYHNDSYKLKLDGGSPDPRLAPIDFLLKECKSLYKSRSGHRHLNYDDPRGSLNLRRSLSQYLSESRGITANPNQILITNGSQMGIYLAMQAIVKPNDCVVVGHSSYDAADWTAIHCGAKLLRIQVDAKGLDIDQLEHLIKKHTPKLIYITPHHHFPTTVTLCHERRLKLLQLAIRHNAYILEDDYDFDFHYKGSPILPLASINTGGRIIYIGSFSKVFAPSIRVGYVVAPKGLITHMAKHRRLIDRQADRLMQEAIHQSIEQGILERHLRKSLYKYRERRDFLSDELSARFANQLYFDKPEGGMAIWARFKTSLKDLIPHLETAGLNLDLDKELAGKFNGVRLGFASKTTDELNEAVILLETAFKSLASSASS